MTARQAAVHKAKDCYWHVSRRGVTQAGFTRTAEGWQWQGESTDGREWRVALRPNGALAKVEAL